MARLRDARCALYNQKVVASIRRHRKNIQAKKKKHENLPELHYGFTILFV